MPLSERTSSVALSASWWLKTIVSEYLSSKRIVVNFCFELRKISTRWRRFLTGTPLISLTILVIRVVVALADLVGKHRRCDHDQLLALEPRADRPGGSPAGCRSRRAGHPLRSSAEANSVVTGENTIGP